MSRSLGQENHRARVLIDRCLVRNFLDVNVEDSACRQVVGFRVHEVAFEDNLDPGAVLRDGENDTGGVFNRRDRFFSASVIHIARIEAFHSLRNFLRHINHGASIREIALSFCVLYG